MKDEAAITALFNKSRTHILLIKRRDVPVWVLPGGKIECNETPEEAAWREAKEETGCDVVIQQAIGIYTPTNRLTKKTFLYSGYVHSTPEQSSDEALRIKFFPLNRLPKMLPPPFKSWIQDAYLCSPSLINRPLHEITYTKFIIKILSHPILIVRFLLSRCKIPINS